MGPFPRPADQAVWFSILHEFGMEVDHHCLKLFVIDLVILVFIELLYKVLPLISGNLHLTAKSLTHDYLNRFNRNLPCILNVIIQVKQVKGMFQVQFGEHNADLVCFINELLVLDVSITVFVHLLNYLPEILFQY